MYNTLVGAIPRKIPAPHTEQTHMKPQNKKDLIAAYKQRAQIGGIYAVTNTITGRALVLASADILGIRKRYEFAEATGGCFHPKLQQDVNRYGSGAFTFAVLEELEKKATQTDREFADDLDMLLGLWLEKYDRETVY
jgi:hypothetical protein